MTSSTEIAIVSNPVDDSKLTDDPRSKTREQLIENLQRVLQEKNASIAKLEEREQLLQETLKKRNAEFHQLEDRLKQYEEKTHTFEHLHRLQVQTFEKTIRDNQIENERLCEQVNDLTNELREKSAYDVINQEKLQTFDRIVADIRLWREKLDSYKATIEEREETIANLKKEIQDFQKKKQTNVEVDDNSVRLQLIALQSVLQDRDKQIENLKLTLRRVRDTLQPGHLSRQNRWQSYHENLHQISSPMRTPKKRSLSPPLHDRSAPADIDGMQKKIRTLTDQVANLQELLVQRDEQVAMLRKVHDKRWIRLKHLQKQYRSLKDELQLYTDDESLQRNHQIDYSYRKAVRKNKIGCSICNDHRWRKVTGANQKIFRHEDDDQIWNEVTKLRKDNARLCDENLTLQEKLDLQQVEINEQITIIGELRNEIRAVMDKTKSTPIKTAISPVPTKLHNDQTRLIEEMDQKLYELENERTGLIVEQERLKTSLELCTDEKQNLLQQRNQMRSELKKTKLRILALQDQIHKLKRNQTKTLRKEVNNAPVIVIKRRIIKKKPKKPMVTKSCLELLLDQNSTIVEDLQDEKLVSPRPSTRLSNLYGDPLENSLHKRTRRASVTSSTLSRKRCGILRRNSNDLRRTSASSTRVRSARKPSNPSSSDQQTVSSRISALRDRIEQLEGELADARTENEHLQQRLSSTLTRITMLKTANEKLSNECNQKKSAQSNSPSGATPHSPLIDHNNQQIEHLYERLKNTSLDAAQQRKLNKTLQAEIETLNKHLQTLNEKLIHTERDLNSKRVLIENYKSQLEIQATRGNEKSSNEQNDERLKNLTDMNEKLRTSIDSYKNRLQAVTRDKHDLDLRYNQLADEQTKLKTRLDEVQTKLRTTDQQYRQLRIDYDQVNKELFTARRLSEDQFLSLTTKNQDTLNKMRIECDRAQSRSNECEKFVKEFLHDMFRRSSEMQEALKRAHEHQKTRDSLSMTLPGYDAAMNTASKILNLTQDDLDEIMSITDESFQIKVKAEATHKDKDEKMKEKVTKLFASQEQFAGKLLKIFQKKLDEIQTVDRELASMRNT